MMSGFDVWLGQYHCSEGAALNILEVFCFSSFFYWFCLQNYIFFKVDFKLEKNIFLELLFGTMAMNRVSLKK